VNNHDDPTPARGNLSLDERLERIELQLLKIQESLDGIPTRVRALEYVVYGGCGVVLLAVLTALITLVLKSHP
jgi:hypothetical protein